jgi:PhzF family phenazine biosynthesis protein
MAHPREPLHGHGQAGITRDTSRGPSGGRPYAAGMRIFQVDAFTAAAFAGNPAAVCLLPGPAEAAWMQRVAAEMNLSETAFLEPRQDGYGLRWFTPAAEVALCGHATLASAHVLYETGLSAPDQDIRFATASGELTARREGAGISLDFPATPATEAEPPPGVLAALGIGQPAWAGRSIHDILIVLAAEQDVTALEPDFSRLAPAGLRGTIVTAPASQAQASQAQASQARASEPEADFVSRFFAPAVGVAEDPVTGSAHCTLAPYWGERLGRTALTGYQASARGGTVLMRLAGDRVILTGHAVTVLRGELTSAALGAG